ncbi:class I SAM-dependent methyltransferase [Haloglycomyces albus]|uniref:class I SAM-dependent methyltransferase n=1 Tax=Haloglycomyces albus TaxID=526067 RepID=UPI00046C996F|nr:class I SAM-dependent methyltransferase [Haloglycomyces albus]
MLELDPFVHDYYEQGGEVHRLNQDARGRLEFIRTQDLVRRSLPGRSLDVLDVGGATGVHSAWLHDDGHNVTLIDPVESQVEQARSIPGITATVGDARDLPFADNSFDVVLLLGPLYHLLDRSDRVRALAEAGRVARSTVVIATINRTASWTDSLRRRGPSSEPLMTTDEDLALIETGALDIPESAFTRAYLHWPAGIAAEAADADLSLQSQALVEGPVYEHSRLEEFWAHEPTRDNILRVLRRVETEPSLLCTGSHLLTIAGPER